MADVRGAFLIIAGIIAFSAALLVILAPEGIAEYTVIDIAFHKTEHRLIGKTTYNFNNASEIAKFPKRIDGWRGIDFRYPPRVYEVLEADIILSRAYSKGGKIIWMDIINSERRKSFHDPRICYGATWNIVGEKVESVSVNSTAAIFEKIYVNRIDLVNKKNPEKRLVVLYWFMFKRGEGVTMIRLSSPVDKSYEETSEVMKDFVRKIMGIMYEEVKRQRSMGEAILEKYEYAGVGIIAAMFLPSAVLIGLGVRMRSSQ